MHTIFPKRIMNLEPSPTLAMDQKVKTLQVAGVTIANLSIGEPDFETPEHIKKEAIRAINAGFTHYTETAGILSLRKAIVYKLAKENGIQYDPSEILVGVGTKHILYELLQVLCHEGDEVIVALPTWSTYVEQIKLAGGKPVCIQLKPPFKLTAKDVEKKMTKKTKILMLNSPANPTGAMIEKKELKKIAKLVEKNDIFVLSDEIYEKILYGSEAVSIASFGKKVKEQTFTINGVSKAFAMTGWRIGYVAGRKDVITKVTALQGQITSNASSISQAAALAALTGRQKPVRDMTKAFKKRRDFLCRQLQSIARITILPPEGAFYLFVGIEQLLNKRYPTATAWCEGLLQEEKVAVVAGEAFLYPGYFRLSFAAPMEDLQKGTDGIKRFAQKTL